MDLHAELAEQLRKFQAQILELVRCHVMSAVRSSVSISVIGTSTDGTKMPRPKAEALECSTSDCGAVVLAKGLCRRCYSRDYQKRKRSGETTPRALGDGYKPPLPAVGDRMFPKRPKRKRPLAPLNPQGDGPIAEATAKPKALTSEPKQHKEKPRSPSMITARSRAAIERTKLARAELDGLIATDEPDPEFDSLPVVEFGPPKLTRAAREAIEAAEDAGEDYVPPEPRKHPRLHCSFCQEDGHQRGQCPELRANISSVVEESSIVTATTP